MSKESGRVNIVIVGGGSAGTYISRALSGKLDPSKYNLILVNPLPFSIWRPAGARLTTSDAGRLEDTAFVPYDKLFIDGNGSLKVGKVAIIDPIGGSPGGILTLEGGEKLSYEILVLATGSIWAGAIAFPDRKDELTTWLRDWRAKYEKANHILFVGGGAVGIESAGEIKDRFPKKKVTIVQGDSMLVNKTYPNKFRSALHKSLTARGVEIIYNDFVDEIPSEGIVQSVTTRNGKRVDADLVVLTTGPRPNTSFASTLGSDTLTERGFIKVKPTLQLLHHSDIYAAGDVVDWNEQKQAVKCKGHSEVVVANVISTLAGRTPASRYEGSAEMILVTTGKDGGAGYIDKLWGILFGARLVSMLKGKTLLVPMARKNAGLA